MRDAEASRAASVSVRGRAIDAAVATATGGVGFAAIGVAATFIVTPRGFAATRGAGGAVATGSALNETSGIAAGSTTGIAAGGVLEIGATAAARTAIGCGALVAAH